MTGIFTFGSSPFFFLRHGETDFNRDRLAIGQLDIPLNDDGRTQARRAGEILVGCDIRSIFSSPLDRTMETAEIVSRAIQVPVMPLAGLEERNKGIFQGQDRSGLPPQWETPEGGEAWSDFVARNVAALETVRTPGPVLVVGHSGTFRVLREHLGIAFEKQRVSKGIPVLIRPPEDSGAPWILDTVNQ
jgi:2,3-bisphosphoglycerate-dependent phosphoglycerate mutase